MPELGKIIGAVRSPSGIQGNMFPVGWIEHEVEEGKASTMIKVEYTTIDIPVRLGTLHGKMLQQNGDGLYVDGVKIGNVAKQYTL